MNIIKKEEQQNLWKAKGLLSKNAQVENSTWKFLEYY